MKANFATASSALALVLVLAGPDAIATESANQDRERDSGSHEARQSEREASGGTDAGHAGESTGSGQAEMSGSGQTGTMGQAVRVDELTGSKIVNDSGEEIGEVKKVVRGKDGGKTQAVLSVGGMLGFGDKEVLMPLDGLRMDGDKLRAPKDSANTREQRKQHPSYDPALFEQVSGDTTVSLGSGGMSTHQGGSARGH